MTTRRDPRRRRRSPVRDERRRILVVCGAEKTESAYFKGLRDYRRATAVSLAIVEKARVAPDEVVRHAARKMATDDYHEVWCVVDVDHYERDGGKVSEAVRLAGRSGIRLAASNPCFEVWLLLHHAGCSTHCTDCRVAENLLKRKLPGYDKTRLNFADFEAGVPAAVARARKLDPDGRDHSRNPSTGVWPLVDTIMEAE